jgi:FtsH-binding integral membrane protein
MTANAPADGTERTTTPEPSAGERPRRHNVLGYLGIGLGVLAMVGVASPSILFEFVGGVLLIAALAVSVIAIFRPRPKWPAFVGIGICVIAAVTATVMFLVGFLGGVASTFPG